MNNNNLSVLIPDTGKWENIPLDVRHVVSPNGIWYEVAARWLGEELGVERVLVEVERK